MAEVTTVARPYAEAVFKLADQSNSLGAWSSALERMAQVAANADVLACINNPNLSGPRTEEFFLSLCGDLPLEGKNFVSTLVENGRLALLPSIHLLFEASKHAREGAVDANVESAFPLNDAQLGALVGQLESKYRRKVTAKVSVNPELIGGVRIAVGDEVIDGSVRGKLDNMRAVLAS